MIDLLWSALYIVLTLISDEIRVKELFFAHREAS